MGTRGVGRVARLAGVTGLEPAASGVTGQRSNQLSYTPEASLGALLKAGRVYGTDSPKSS